MQPLEYSEQPGLSAFFGALENKVLTGKSSFNSSLLSLIFKEKEKRVLTGVNVLSQHPELRVVLKSHQTTLLDSIYLKKR